MMILTHEIKSILDKLVSQLRSGSYTETETIIKQIAFLVLYRDLEVVQKYEIPTRLKWSSLKSTPPNELNDHFRKIEEFIRNEGIGKVSPLLEKDFFQVTSVSVIYQLIEGVCAIFENIEMLHRKHKINSYLVLGGVIDYLLSTLKLDQSSGQYRTLDAITNTIILLCQPNEDIFICDPSSGTGGFLAKVVDYYIAKGVEIIGDKLHGYDNFGKMTMYSEINLHIRGVRSAIFDTVDSLSEQFDTTVGVQKYPLILANIPYSGKPDLSRISSKLGGSKRIECLFMNRIIDLMAEKSWCAVIVPDGLLTKTSGDYLAIRKKLVEVFGLKAVISLPTQKPYSTTKTSILIIDRQTAKTHHQKVWFYEVKKDLKELSLLELESPGVDMKQLIKEGIGSSSLINLIEEWEHLDSNWQAWQQESAKYSTTNQIPIWDYEKKGWFVTTDQIAQGGLFKLSGTLYKPDVDAVEIKSNLATLLREIVQIEKENVDQLGKHIQSLYAHGLVSDADFENINEGTNALYDMTDHVGQRNLQDSMPVSLPSWLLDALSAQQRDLYNFFLQSSRPYAIHEVASEVSCDVQSAKQTVEMLERIGLIQKVKDELPLSDDTDISELKALGFDSNIVRYQIPRVEVSQ